MHPTAARSNRSSLQSSISPVSTPSPLLHPSQQHQQQILYGPIPNPVVTLQPCAASLHPSCLYPGTQRSTAIPNPVPLHIQGKNNRWPSKNKVLRGHQQYCQQQQQQHVQQVSYNPKPLVLFDKTGSNGPPPPPTTSFLLASSTFTHGSFSGDQYNPSGVTLIPQPYFKPPEVQTFCLVQDRGAQQQQQEQSTHGSYYNISATNACSLQTNPTFQFPNLGPYASVATFTNNQISGPVQTVQSTQIFPNPPVSLVFGGPQREKPSSLSTLDISTFKCTRSKLPAVNNSHVTPVASESYHEWPSQCFNPPPNSMQDTKSINDDANNEITESSVKKVHSNLSTKTQDYSDESSVSFDFTIEAEKMVSALCNTTSSNDIGKDEMRNSKSNSAPLFSGAGDTASNKNTWFADFCTGYGTSTSIAIQTDGPCLDRSQYPELIRKAAFWGCTEAETILNPNSKIDSKCSWLKNLSSATKTAITKSSTCFPIFAGDQIFTNDLISALLRISNGWLILDNYLNKQHYPNIDGKFDNGLVTSFQMWEENTHELLREIVKTFLRLQENGDASDLEAKPAEPLGNSFPGDVSLYTTYDLFDPSSSMNLLRQDSSNKKNDQEYSFNSTQFASPRLSTDRLQNCRQQKQCTQKETKLRSKWTVTENLTSTIDSTKSVPTMFVGHTDLSAQANGRFRARTSRPPNRIDSSTQSLNAEFFHLKSKVLESNRDTSRHRMVKDKRQEIIDNKIPSSESGLFRLQRSMVDASCENTYKQKYLPRVESFPNPSMNLESEYFTSNVGNVTSLDPNYGAYPPYTFGYSNKCLKNIEQTYGDKSSNIDLVYVGKSSTNQLELAAVPKNKMTLLSQIEPSIPDKASEEMTANLSAWFASMRNPDGNQQIPITNIGEMRNADNIVPRLTRQDVSKNAIDLSRQLQIDANRQLQTLQNMQSIQSAPWNACNLINNRVQVHQILEEYDSSEDVRVYMKPGSYNVPKKRHQRRSNRRLDNSPMPSNLGTDAVGNHRNHYSNKEKTLSTPASSTPVLRSTMPSVSSNVNNNTTMKLSFSSVSSVLPSIFSLENSPRILKRSDSPAFGIPQDITWKAACASAEILLEALNVKDPETVNNEIIDVSTSEDKKDTEKNESVDAALKLLPNRENSLECLSKTLKQGNDGCAGASSYEASEDDSGSTSHLSPNMSINETSQLPENKNGFKKANMKTDSWLIRTLNNASIAGKQKRRKNNTNRHSSESSNSSVIEDEQTLSVLPPKEVDTATTITTTMPSVDRQQISSKGVVDTPLSTKEKIPEKIERGVEKATYSETVRRFTPSNSSHSEKKETCKKSKFNTPSTSTVCSTLIPIPGRRCQRKDSERSYHLLHKSRKSSGKRSAKNCDTNDTHEDGSCVKTKILKNEIAKDNLSIASCVSTKSTSASKHGKKKDHSGSYGDLLDNKFTGKSSDRGWSVWYSSKRKQSLSPLALNKLEMIHQAVWQMEESQIFKCPASNNNCDNQSLTIENYCKVIKSPMFLETVEYKLKNRVYHKVEHAVRDFRRIVYNSKLYHKNDHDRVKTIDTLSKKLEELFQEHFSSWDFGDISGSPREDSPLLQRLKLSGQKPISGRYGNTKKSPSSSIIAENV